MGLLESFASSVTRIKTIQQKSSGTLPPMDHLEIEQSQMLCWSIIEGETSDQRFFHLYYLLCLILTPNHVFSNSHVNLR